MYQSSTYNFSNTFLKGSDCQNLFFNENRHTDYYPFGMLMPNRHGSDLAPADDYKYGFNGMEKDDEVRNTKGASYDFGARMLEPRIGRWLSVDPLEKKYTALSPYCFVANTPIIAMDPDGERIKIVGSWKYRRAVKKQLRYLMKNSSSARAMLKEAMKADEIIYIYSSQDKSEGASEKTIVRGLKETKNGVVDQNNNSKIVFNLETAGKEYPKAGKGETPLENTSAVTLAHEIFHGLQSINGTTSRNDVWNLDESYVYDDEGKRHDNKLPVSEVEASQFENKVRAELGLDLRHYYHSGISNFNIFNKKVGTDKRGVITLVKAKPTNYTKLRKDNEVLSEWMDGHIWKHHVEESEERSTDIDGSSRANKDVDHGGSTGGTTELKYD